MHPNLSHPLKFDFRSAPVRVWAWAEILLKLPQHTVSHTNWSRFAWCSHRSGLFLSYLLSCTSHMLRLFCTSSSCVVVSEVVRYVCVGTCAFTNRSHSCSGSYSFGKCGDTCTLAYSSLSFTIWMQTATVLPHISGFVLGGVGALFVFYAICAYGIKTYLLIHAVSPCASVALLAVVGEILIP